MKKLIIFIFIITAAFVKSNAADITPVNENIVKAFGKEFRSVKDVAWSWVADRDLYKASFLFEGKELNAYFAKDGEFVGTSRYITRQQMPVIVSQEIDKKYGNFIVRTIIEFASKDQTNYFITLEGKQAALMVKASPAGELTYFKKLKKP